MTRGEKVTVEPGAAERGRLEIEDGCGAGEVDVVVDGCAETEG